MKEVFEQSFFLSNSYRRDEDSRGLKPLLSFPSLLSVYHDRQGRELVFVREEMGGILGMIGVDICGDWVNLGSPILARLLLN